MTTRIQRWRTLLKWCVLTALLAWLGMMIYHSFKPLPQGISVAAPATEVEQVRFLADLTWVDDDDVRTTDQQIFDRILELIGQAEQLIVLDKFLFNAFAGLPDGPNMRPLSDQLTEALLTRKTDRPDVRVVLITDPINTLYGGLDSDHLNVLRQAGIEVVITDLTRLRDSNPLWSGFWRLCCQWFGNSSNGGWLPNPVGREKVSLRTWLKLINFKANHRKTLVVDRGNTWTGLVTSGNPHDASSAHGNVALEYSGAGVLHLLQSEQAVVDFSKPELGLLAQANNAAGAVPQISPAMQVLTESKIRDYVISTLEHSGPGARVDLAMFYLSHRGVVRSLIDAHERGVELRVLLDPSEDAFGKKKNGIPNRQVAWELHRAGIPVRWCDTHGEQCHSKFMLVRKPDEQDYSSTTRAALLLGSANFTRRNLDDFNLETNLLLQARSEYQAMIDAADFFELRWNNAPNQHFSRPYEYYADHSHLRYWRYRLMEATGLSTF